MKGVPGDNIHKLVSDLSGDQSARPVTREERKK